MTVGIRYWHHDHQVPVCILSVLILFRLCLLYYWLFVMYICIRQKALTFYVVYFYLAVLVIHLDTYIYLFFTHLPTNKVQSHISDIFCYRFTQRFVNDMTFRIEFTINRLSIRMEHRAVSEMVRNLRNVLFPDPRDYVPTLLVSEKHQYRSV